MFFVSDTLESRQAKILKFLDDGEPVIAALLAAADFEWTVRRAILLLSKDSNREIRKDLEKCSNLKKYKESWKNHVYPVYKKRITEVVKNWQYLDKAMSLRHKLIHGVKGTTSVEYARSKVEIIMSASKDVVDFASKKEKDIFDRLKIRRKPRDSAED